MADTIPVRYFSTKDLANRYGCNIDKIHVWINSGELVAINTALKHGAQPRWKISPEAVAEFEASRSSSLKKTTVKARKRRTPDRVIQFF